MFVSLIHHSSCNLEIQTWWTLHGETDSWASLHVMWLCAAGACLQQRENHGLGRWTALMRLTMVATNNNMVVVVVVVIVMVVTCGDCGQSDCCGDDCHAVVVVFVTWIRRVRTRMLLIFICVMWCSLDRFTSFSKVYLMPSNGVQLNASDCETHHNIQ